ncbi:MAG: sulfotransferase [Candidatus Thorarchaeota archaeon]
MAKILIIGFQHSGTTLLRALINSHPQVSMIYHEGRIIELNKSKEFIMKIVSDMVYPDGKKMSWGDKIPWMDGKGDRIIRLSKRWLKFFGKSARVILILRHPLDIALSIAPVQYKKELKLIMRSTPKVIDFVNQDRRCSVVLYEDLVLKPYETLRELFLFCGLRADKKVVRRVAEKKDLRFGGINPKRAFAYRRKGFGEVVDYEKLVGGVKRKL